jgi:hypothetical protein
MSRRALRRIGIHRPSGPVCKAGRHPNASAMSSTNVEADRTGHLDDAFSRSRVRIWRSATFDAWAGQFSLNPRWLADNHFANELVDVGGVLRTHETQHWLDNQRDAPAARSPGCQSPASRTSLTLVRLPWPTSQDEALPSAYVAVAASWSRNCST